MRPTKKRNLLPAIRRGKASEPLKSVYEKQRSFGYPHEGWCMNRRPKRVQDRDSRNSFVETNWGEFESLSHTRPSIPRRRMAL